MWYCVDWLDRGFCAELEAPPLSSQTFDLPTMWYCVWLDRGFCAELWAPPLPSQTFYLTTVWYCADWCNAPYWILSWAVSPTSFLTRLSLSSNCYSLFLSLSHTHTPTHSPRDTSTCIHTLTQNAHINVSMHTYIPIIWHAYMHASMHTHTPQGGAGSSVWNPLSQHIVSVSTVPHK